MAASSGSGGGFDLSTKRDELTEVEKKMGSAGFWDNQETAQRVVSRVKMLKATIDPWSSYGDRLDDADVMLELVREASDDEATAELADDVRGMGKDLADLEFKALLSGPLDGNGAYLQVNAGAGGTESCDWAEMLFRMFTRWAERMDFGVKTVDWQANDEAGVRSAMMEIHGPFAFGYLKY